MKKCVDLHLHSHYSDGLHPPSELVRMAAERGIRAIAIADHDSVEGIDEAMEAGQRLGVEVIPAVELSVSLRGYRDVHLLGYLIDHHDPLFAARLEEFRVNRNDRGRAILERINARLLGEKKKCIPYEEVLAVAGGAVGRPHIARVLMGNGLARSIEDAFEKYLGPCNVPRFQIHIADAIAEVKRIGGVAVLAHPPSISKNMVTLKNIIHNLSDMGLDGLELFSNMCYKEDIIYFNNLATQLGILVTGGSDYHGFHEDEEVGKLRGGTTIPYELVERLRDAHAQNSGSMKKVLAI
jgi:3',5'-nucleoside bisphosphate phosphatase